MLVIINILLIIAVCWCLIKKVKYLQAIIYALPVAFNYTPVVFIQLANLEQAQFQSGIEKLNYCILAWNLGFLIQIFIDKITRTANNKYVKIRSGHNELKPSVIVKIFAVFLSINIIFNNISNLQLALNQGYHSIYLKDADLLLKTTTIFPLYIWFNSLLVAHYIINKIKYEKNEKLIKYGIAIYWLSMVTFIVSGSRSTFIYILFTIICIKYSDRTLHVLKTITSAVIIILILSIVGMLRENWDGSSEANVFNRAIIELAQTTSVFINSTEIMTVDLLRYVHLIFTIFPQKIMIWIGVKPPISLAQEYAEMVDPGWAQAGGGFGFSIFAEMYIAGGMVFVLAGSVLIASISSYINKLYKERNNSLAIASCSVISFYLFTLARGDIYDLYRPIVFAIAIYYMSKLKINNGIKINTKKNIV